MVKLFLVCLAVCMGATSEALSKGLVKVGKCSGNVPNTMALTAFHGTYTLCFLPQSIYQELLRTVGEILSSKNKISKVTMERKDEKSVRKGYLKLYFDKDPIPVEGDVVYEGKPGPSTEFKQFTLGDPNEGQAFFNKCKDGKIVSEMCSNTSNNNGPRLLTVWVPIGGKCGSLAEWNNNKCQENLGVAWQQVG